MTTEELRTILYRLNLTQGGLAAALGVNKDTVNSWARGRLPVPKYAEAYLNLREECSRCVAARNA